MPEGDSVHRLAARLRQVDGALVVRGELRGGAAAGRSLAGRRVVEHATHGKHGVVGHLGPDPLRDDFDPDEAVRRLTADRDLPVRTALLDQRRIAGLGNLWANELGFVRGLHPDRAVGRVDVPALVATARRMLRYSAAPPAAGAPDQYQVTTGSRRRGEQHWVVGRAGRPCLRCGTVVRGRDDVEVVGSAPRRVWWCPRCQPPA